MFKKEKQQDIDLSAYRLTDLATFQKPHSTFAGLYHILTKSLKDPSRSLANPGVDEKKIIAFVSPHQLTDTALTAANMAVSLAQQDQRVLLIDCDFYRPKLHSIFDEHNDLGIYELIEHQMHPKEVIVTTLLEKLDFLSTGIVKKGSSTILGSNKMRYFLEKVQKYYDYILLDLPPLNTMQDAYIIASYSDGVLLFLESGKTTFSEAREVREKLLTRNNNLLGTVMITPDMKSSSYYNLRKKS